MNTTQVNGSQVNGPDFFVIAIDSVISGIGSLPAEDRVYYQSATEIATQGKLQAEPVEPLTRRGKVLDVNS